MPHRLQARSPATPAKSGAFEEPFSRQAIGFSPYRCNIRLTPSKMRSCSFLSSRYFAPGAFKHFARCDENRWVSTAIGDAVLVSDTGNQSFFAMEQHGIFLLF